MFTRTMHMGGYATGGARLGVACSTHLALAGNAAPIAAKPWHAITGTQVSPVFGTDRPTPRPLERFP
ncbi:MAG TPA: hypothetical protein VF015_12725 [Acidimicrobiales bacterium]